jgi:hypothetical protein
VTLLFDSGHPRLGRSTSVSECCRGRALEKMWFMWRRQAFVQVAVLTCRQMRKCQHSARNCCLFEVRRRIRLDRRQPPRF